MAAQHKVGYLRDLCCDKTAKHLLSSPRNLVNVSAHQSIPSVTAANGLAYRRTPTPSTRKIEPADRPRTPGLPNSLKSSQHTRTLMSNSVRSSPFPSGRSQWLIRSDCRGSNGPYDPRSDISVIFVTTKWLNIFVALRSYGAGSVRTRIRQSLSHRSESRTRPGIYHPNGMTL